MLEQGQLESWDRESFFHPNTHLGQFVRKEAPQVVMTGGEGVYVYDSNGNSCWMALRDCTVSTSATDANP